MYLHAGVDWKSQQRIGTTVLDMCRLDSACSKKVITHQHSQTNVYIR